MQLGNHDPSDRALAELKPLLDLAAGRTPGATVGMRAVDLAVDHHMEGLLWAAVREGEVSAAPDAARRLAMLQLRHEARHRSMWSDLQFATERLAAIDIELGTFKGVTFERAFYGQIGKRPCFDIDLVISRADRPRLGEIVAALDGEAGRIHEMVELARQGHLETLDFKLPSGNWVDLHLDLFKWEIGLRAPDRVWRRMQLLALDHGATIKVPDTTLALLAALINVNRDRFRTVRGLADIWRILEQGGIDWVALDEIARAEGYAVHVYRTLDVACGLLGIPAPVPIPELGWRAKVWDRVWRRDVRLPGTRGAFESSLRRYYWGPFLVEGRTLTAVRWWSRRVLPPRQVVDYWFPNERGPYLLKLYRGRAAKRRAGIR